MSNAGCEAGGMGANGGAWAGTVDMQHRNAEADRDARRDARGVDFARIIFRGALVVLWSSKVGLTPPSSLGYEREDEPGCRQGCRPTTR